MPDRGKFSAGGLSTTLEAWHVDKIELPFEVVDLADFRGPRQVLRVHAKIVPDDQRLNNFWLVYFCIDGNKELEYRCALFLL
jgi:hypothetical protein